MEKRDSTATLIASLTGVAMLAGVGLAVVVLAGLYVLSPVDAIPDFIPVAGQMDDAAVGGSGLALVAALYYIGQKTGVLPRVMAIVDAILTDAEQAIVSVNEETK